MDYDKQEFEHLFKDNYPHMYRMAFSMVENADDAKDVVHQVFTQMWRGKPKIADESVRGYLLAATRNQCLHLLRSRQLERQMVHDLRQDMDVSESEERKELLQQLQQVIEDNLTEQDRRVLSLHYEEENLRYPSTAQAYGAKGRVIMQFMIDRGGYVSDAKATRFFLKYDTLLLSRESEAKQTELKEQIAQQLEEECARVIAMMPRWTPGKIQGKVVSMKYNLPFLFKPSEFLANTSDTLSEAYVRQHPEVKQSRRYVTGYVVNEETNEPLSNTHIYLSLWSDFGTMTDSTGALRSGLL